MTVLLQAGRHRSLAEEAVGGGSKHTCAVNRGSHQADGRRPKPIGDKSRNRRPAELAETRDADVESDPEHRDSEQDE